MANPTLPSKEDRRDWNDAYLDVDGIVVNLKQVVSTQQSLVTDAAASTLVATTSTINSGFVRVQVDVDSSAGGTATEIAITTVPAHSIVFNVEAEVLVDMDGDTTQTLEVGLTGNIDKYIDTVDFDPAGGAGTSAASTGGTNNDQKVPFYTGASTEAIVATWTNANSAAAGSTRVIVHYVALDNVDIDDVDTQTAAALVDLNLHRTAINAILDILEAHGLMADA